MNKKIILLIFLIFTYFPYSRGQGIDNIASGQTFTKLDMYKWLENPIFIPKYLKKNELETMTYNLDDRAFEQINIELEYIIKYQYIQDNNKAQIDILYKECQKEYGNISNNDFKNWICVYYYLYQVDLKTTKKIMNGRPTEEWKASQINMANSLKQNPSSSQKYNYDLYGRLKKKLFYGPPNYGKDPLHDRKEYSYILELIQTESFLGTYLGDNESQKFNSITITDYNNQFQLDKYINKPIRVYCTIFEPYTAHYHTKLATEDLIKIIPDKSINELLDPNDGFPINYIYNNYNLLTDELYKSNFSNQSEFKSEEEFYKSDISHIKGIKSPTYEYGIISRVYKDYIPNGEERMVMDINVTRGSGSSQFHPYKKEVFYTFPNSINISKKQQEGYKKLIKVGRRIKFSSIYDGGRNVGIYILSYIKATN